MTQKIDMFADSTAFCVSENTNNEKSAISNRNGDIAQKWFEKWLVVIRHWLIPLSPLPCGKASPTKGGTG
jgi:hypothetical protein